MADRTTRRLRPVGILGGMGPEATVLLMSRIIAATPATDDADHIPLLVYQNPQVPSRIKALIEGEGENPGPVLATMARHLVGAGAEALAMPCNTAHAYVSAIEAAVDTPFISMIELTAARLAAMNPTNGCIGMLASPAVKHAGVYDSAFAAHGLKALFPSPKSSLLDAIKMLKKDANHPEARAIQKRVAEELIAAGADILLIACTELSLIPDAIPEGAPVLDALDVLVGAIRDFSQGSSDAIP